MIMPGVPPVTPIYTLRNPVAARRAYNAAYDPVHPARTTMTDPTDDALMRAWVQGDAAAFERLYARHQAALYRFVRRMLGRDGVAQADEVFQDTWLRAMQARDRWSPQGAAFRTWLFTLAHHRAIDVLRRSGPRDIARHRRARALGASVRGRRLERLAGACRRRRRRGPRLLARPRASACSIASTRCPRRSAALSCSITRTGSGWTNFRGCWKSASRRPRAGFAMP
jgi:RNA polymerase sigma factor (sigma-70 family)